MSKQRRSYLERQVSLEYAVAHDLGAATNQRMERLLDELPTRRYEAVLELERVLSELVLPEGALGRSVLMHNLALAYSELQDGRRGAHVERAIELLRAALLSKPRKRHPRSWGHSALTLSSCLRERSRGQPATAKRRDLDEAERSLESAVDAFRRAGPEAGYHLATAQHALGNLFIERGDTKKARKILESSWETYNKRETLFAPPDFSFTDPPALQREIVLSMAVTAIHAGDTESLSRARQRLAAFSRRDGHVRVRLRLAELALLLGERDDEALADAASDVEALEVPELHSLAPRVAHHASAAVRDRFFRHAIEALIELRRGVYADPAADQIAARVLDLARHWARALGQTEAVQAFLVLEMNSAIRLTEAASRNGWYPQTTTEVQQFNEWRELCQRMNDCAHLALIASSLGRERVAQLRRIVGHAAGRVQLTDDEQRSLDAALVDPTMRFDARDFDALATNQPFDVALSQRASELDEQATRARRVLECHPEFVACDEAVARPLTAEDLQTLLAQYPTHGLLRLEPSEGGLLALYVDGRGPQGLRGQVTHLPMDLTVVDEARRALVRDGNLPVSAAKAFAQLPDFLPAATPRRLVVMPSPLLTVLPLGLFGPDGGTLLDRFEAIVWIPNLSPLRAPCIDRWPRAGVRVLVPGRNRSPGLAARTRFHDIAMSPIAGDAADEMDPDSGCDVVRDALKQTSVVRYYGHARHVKHDPAQPGQITGPQLLLGRGDHMRVDQMLDVAFGLERVELWACESGIDLPPHPVFPWGADGFGFDYELLRAGARTTIGTLWSVDDLATSLIVLRYRVGLVRGLDAALALAEAQRWWSREGRVALADDAEAGTIADRIVRIWRRALDGESTTPEAELRVRDAAHSAHTLNGALNPISHAAYRFSGMPGRKVEGMWPRDDRATQRGE